MIPRKTLQIRSFPNAAKTNYKYDRGTPVDKPNYKASVQVAGPKMLETLEEGRRNRQSFLLYGKPADINVLSDTVKYPDQVLIYGDWYEFIKKAIWTNNLINHHWYLVQKVTTK